MPDEPKYTSWSKADAAGATFYYPANEPCPHGHTPMKRYTRSWDCVECTRMYRQRHRDKKRAEAANG